MKNYLKIAFYVLLAAAVFVVPATSTELRNIFITDATTGQTAAVEQNGGLAVNIQDQHSLALDLKFIQAQGSPTMLSSSIAPDDLTIDVDSTVGFVSGNTVGIFSTTGIFYFGTQIGAPAGSTITLDTPIDKAFAAGDNVITAVSDMAVNGAATTQIFQIGPVGGATAVEIDITRFMGYLQDGTAMDDAKFGGITALTNGIVLRINDGAMQNLWNAKSNADLALLTFDFMYTDKAPAGSFGARFRNSYAGPEKHGVTIRLAPGDILELLIQDNLTGLEQFKMMAQGHVVTD